MTALPLLVAPQADPLDAYRHGEFRPGMDEPAVFRDRVVPAPFGRFPAVAGRYHLYTATPSPGAHRVEILRALTGLESAVTSSRLDPLRDGRGWAFRGPTGTDPVNGFTLLRDAYEASRPGYRGPVDVPVLWDRVEGRIVSDDADLIAADLVHAFGADPLPAGDDGFELMIGEFLAGQRRALHDAPMASTLRRILGHADRRLGARPFLAGHQLTDTDVYTWVALVRYDLGVNAHRQIGPELPAYRALWRWAKDLASMPAFASTTDYREIAAPFADVSHWQNG